MTSTCRVVASVALCAIAATLASACGGAAEVGGGEPDRDAITSGTITEIGPETPDGVLPGCRLLAEVDPALHERLQAGLVGESEHGPLVLVEVDGVDVVVATISQEPGVAGSVAAWQVDGERITSLGEVAAASSSFALEPVDPAGADALADAVAEAAECSSAAGDHPPPDGSEPAPDMRPELLVVEPAEASPGDRVALRFPEETMRGVAFQLDRHSGDGWTTTHLMTSDGNGGEPDTVPVGTEGYGWEDVGVGGPGPDHVRLPADAAPGSYRICTANARDDFCAPVEITR